MSVFPSKHDVKFFIFNRSVQEKKPFVIGKSEPGRVVVRCTRISCSFKMVFRGVDGGTYELVKDQPHNRQSFCPTLKRAWVRKMVEMMKRADKRVKPKAIMERLKAEFDVDVGNVLIKNALSDVRAPLYDNQAFGLVSSFLDSLARSNEGTTTSVSTLEGVFQRAFLCPGICSRAFQHTTKVAGLDACHIKTLHGGVILLMTILDGNGSIFPVAVGVAESENADTWLWFLGLVKTALQIVDDGEGVVFLSDREKGIDSSLAIVFPRSAHSFCTFHIQKNVKQHYHTTLGGLLFRAANAGSAKDFTDTIAQMRRINPEATAYIEGIPAGKWARAFFPMRRLGHVTSNIAESMNHWLEEARRQDPVGLFASYIRQLNNVFDRRRRRYASSPEGTLPKRVFKLLSESVKQSANLAVRAH